MTKAPNQAVCDPKDDFYARNIVGISMVEFSWGLGMPIVIESTFLQLFITRLGASSFEVGLIPTLFFFGTSFFSLLASYTTARMRFKQKPVFWLHLLSGLSLLAFGVFLRIFGPIEQILTVFFLSYAVFSLVMGMTIPVWYNYLVHIFSEQKAVSGIAFMLIAQNLAKLIGSLVIVRIVDAYAFSTSSSAYLFIGVGGLFALGSFFFLLTREVPADMTATDWVKKSLLQYTLVSARHMLNNLNFLKFLAGDFGFYAVVTVISFYANFATTYCGVSPAIAAGLFVAAVYVGAIAASFFLGTLNWLGLKQKYLLSNGLSCIAIVLLVWVPLQWVFLLSSWLLGAARGTRMVAYAPAVKKISGLADSTSYFAISPLLMLPFAAGLPLLAGRFLDHFAALGGDAYRWLFLFCAGLALVSFLFIRRTDF